MGPDRSGLPRPAGKPPLRVLALEPYHGGSHAAFLDGWRRHGRHRWTVETLPASHWKWRMRGAAVTLAGRVARRCGEGGADGGAWDLLLCSDMLDLAAFRGLAPAPVRDLPAVVYFHENQLTYPSRSRGEAARRDLHFPFTNLTTCLAADAAWFNSAYHRNAWLAALPGLLARFPDHRPRRAVERVAERSRVEPPGIDLPAAPRPAERPPGPLRLLWAARWEHDKAPERFFAAVGSLQDRGVDFRLSVVGEAFREVPPVFAEARERFAGRVDRWGWQESRADYEAALAEADVVVSTADHEFFGLAVVEAVAAGCLPLLPRRLAYPEVLAEVEGGTDDFLYGGGGADETALLADRLEILARRLEACGGTRAALWNGDPGRARRAVVRYAWPRRAPALDAALAAVASG